MRLADLTQIQDKYDAPTLRAHLQSIMAFQKTPAGEFLCNVLEDAHDRAQAWVNDSVVLMDSDKYLDADMKAVRRILDDICEPGFGIAPLVIMKAEELEAQKKE